MEGSTRNEGWFVNYKLHWIGFIVISLIHSVVDTLTNNSLSSSIFLSFVGYLFLYGIVTISLSLFLAILIRRFGKLDMSLFANILLLLSFILLTGTIISLALDFVRSGLALS